MKSKFAVFIISHERANNQLTYELLRRCGYTGPIYIVVDDEDEELELYKELYGDEVKVFNKDSVMDDTDMMDNFRIKRNCVLSCNYCFQLANELNLDYFMKFDDDFYDLRYRYIKNDNLKSLGVTRLNEVFDEMIDFMSNSGVDVISFGNVGSYIGGVEGRFKEGIGRNNGGCFLVSSRADLRYIGTRQEDFNTNVKYTMMGKLFFELLAICFYTSQRGENKGGCYQDYKDTGMYVVNFYSLLVAPSSCCIVFEDDFKIRRNWNAIVPKILNERWKK